MTHSSPVNVDHVQNRCGVEAKLHLYCTYMASNVLGNLQIYCTCKSPYNGEFMIGYSCCGEWLHDVYLVVVSPQGTDDLANMNICRQIATCRSRVDQLVYLGIA